MPVAWFIPVLALLGLVTLYPTAFVIWMSFQKTSYFQLQGFVGLRNYEQIFTIYPAFWSAVRNNVLWLVVLLLIATPIGMLLAYLLDKGLRGSLFYQTAFFMPVVLSLAVIGIIWQFMYAPELGLINNVLGKTAPGDQIDWLGDQVKA